MTEVIQVTFMIHLPKMFPSPVSLLFTFITNTFVLHWMVSLISEPALVLLQRALLAPRRTSGYTWRNGRAARRSRTRPSFLPSRTPCCFRVRMWFCDAPSGHFNPLVYHKGGKSILSKEIFKCLDSVQIHNTKVKIAVSVNMQNWEKQLFVFFFHQV